MQAANPYSNLQADLQRFCYDARGDIPGGSFPIWVSCSKSWGCNQQRHILNTCKGTHYASLYLPF